MSMHGERKEKKVVVMFENLPENIDSVVIGRTKPSHTMMID